jgi:hypothetical protein
VGGDIADTSATNIALAKSKTIINHLLEPYVFTDKLPSRFFAMLSAVNITAIAFSYKIDGQATAN